MQVGHPSDFCKQSHGEVVYQNGEFTKVDKAAMLGELAASLQVPLSDAERHRRNLAAQLVPCIQRYYKDWLDPLSSKPFYHQNSRY